MPSAQVLNRHGPNPAEPLDPLPNGNPPADSACAIACGPIVLDVMLVPIKYITKQGNNQTEQNALQMPCFCFLTRYDDEIIVDVVVIQALHRLVEFTPVATNPHSRISGCKPRFGLHPCFIVRFTKEDCIITIHPGT